MRQAVHIWLREENADPDELAGYILELARELDAHPRKMRLVIESSVPAALDIDPASGDLVATVKGQSKTFCVRRRWLPEHPVPLVLGSGAGRCRTRLLIEPVEGNRFRVRRRRMPPPPRTLYALFAAAATAAAVTLHPAALVAAGVLLSALIVMSLPLWYN